MNIGQLYQLFLQYPSIQTDTRRLKKGDLFFALKGPSFNGNGFAAQALQLGAAYAIIDEAPDSGMASGSPAPATAAHAPTSPPQPNAQLAQPARQEPAPPDPRMILVTDVLQTLQDLARHHRMQLKIPFIAITGSNGKTTTKELIHAVLASTYITYTTQGNLNNHIGVPLTILSIKADARFAVIEMGANHQGEIAGYCQYTLPDHGLITNAGKAHLEGFGGPEGVRKGKGELFDYLRTTAGTAFVMWDYDYLREMSLGIPHIVKYGTQDADYTGAVYQQPASPAVTGTPESGNQPAPAPDPRAGTFLRVTITGGVSPGIIHTQLVGDYNLPNVLAAVAVGKHFGVPDERIRSAIEGYAPSNSRSQLVRLGDNQVILDAYNANPSSMKAAIENFARMGHAGGGGKVLILGAMAELGPESLKEHQAIVDLIGSYDWRQVLVVGGDFLRAQLPGSWLSFENARQAGEWLKSAGLRNAYILIKGSRSMQMEQVLGNGRDGQP